MIHIADNGPLRTITLARPDKANALTRQMLADIGAAFAPPPAIRCVILTAQGTVFSAGADLDAARAGLATDPIWAEVSNRIAALPCLTIAALNGTVAGGAFGMVLACDIRLCAAQARFFYPVMRLGYLPQPPDPARLTALIGPARAKMILLGGAKIDAPEALAWGLVDRIMPPEELMDAAHALAGDAIAAAPQHLAAIKAMVPHARTP
jgi:enoyl-CoA hydratase/carnithine racemase